LRQIEKISVKFCHFFVRYSISFRNSPNFEFDIFQDRFFSGIRLSYAVVYEQFLGFFQLFCLKNDAKFFKSLSFKKFEQQLKQFLELS